jgi:hypothetical protein
MSTDTVSLTNLSVDNGVFSIDDDLSRRRDHEGRHHRRRLLPLQCWNPVDGEGGK